MPLARIAEVTESADPGRRSAYKYGQLGEVHPLCFQLRLHELKMSVDIVSSPAGDGNPMFKEKTQVRTQNIHDAREQDERRQVESTPGEYSKLSVFLMIVFSGLAIGSDGFNAAIIGNIELIMAVIYPDSLTTAVQSRLSNAFMVGMIIGMLSFGYVSDKLGRKAGAVLTTTILVLGIALSAGASGVTQDGMFWMLIIARGIAGVGAGG